MGREETGVEEGDLSGFREEGDKRGRGTTREGEGEGCGDLTGGTVGGQSDEDERQRGRR